MNVNGGAIALGHPIGASGARVLHDAALCDEGSRRRKGLATLCLGGRRRRCAQCRARQLTTFDDPRFASARRESVAHCDRSGRSLRFTIICFVSLSGYSQTGAVWIGGPNGGQLARGACFSGSRWPAWSLATWLMLRKVDKLPVEYSGTGPDRGVVPRC